MVAMPWKNALPSGPQQDVALLHVVEGTGGRAGAVVGREAGAAAAVVGLGVVVVVVEGTVRLVAWEEVVILGMS